MYCISQFCRICICNDGTLLHIYSLDNDNISYYDKLAYCQPHFACEKTNIMSFICKTCCMQLRNSYEFLKMCSNSKLILEDYVYQLESVISNKEANKLAELMEENLNEVNAKKKTQDSSKTKVFHSEIEMIKVVPECHMKESDENINLPNVDEGKLAKQTPRISIVPSEKLKNPPPEKLYKEMSGDEFNKEAYEVLFQMNYNLKKTSNLIATNRKITKQGLEIIELCPTLPYSQTPARPDLMNVKTEYDLNDDMEDTNDSSQFSEPEDAKLFNYQSAQTNPDEESNDSSTKQENQQLKQDNQQLNQENPDGKSDTKKDKTISTGKIYQCDYCQKIFNQAGHLKTHIYTHTGQKPYKCHICGNSFTQSSVLNRHILTHSDEKPHCCHLCDKRFAHTSNLRKHLKTHTPEASFECEICRKTFNQKSYLKKHLWTHTDYKPHKCELCGKQFLESSNLRSHMYKHENVKPFKCEMCPKAFKHLISLSAHINAHNEVEILKE